MTNPYDINAALCRRRQQRLREVMARRGLSHVIVTQREHVQWLTGCRYDWTLAPAAALRNDGCVTLVCPQKVPEVAAADEVLTYEAKRHSTLRNDQREASSQVLMDALGHDLASASVGVEFSSFGLFLACRMEHDRAEDIEPDLYRLRRHKEADELARLRRAIAATGRMYEVAREMIRPGINELELFNALQGAAVSTCGEMLTGTGNDYQCNARGGPPRDRPAAAGELYILDLGPAYRGYFADNARTIAVSKADSVQQEAWRHVVSIFPIIEREVRPGVSCRALFARAQAELDGAPHGVFNHHLGHGIGLYPHEAPHLNPAWDDVFEEGDVFAVEPGLYDPLRLRAGIRIENDYVVTSEGVELLSDFPWHL